MAIQTGTRLATYEIAALLGAGGMGEVYRARDAKLGRDVALKVLAPRFAGDRDALARFEQEARSASALSHPHILHIYDIGTADVGGESLRYMTMELVDGETLSAKIDDDSVALNDLLNWLAQVADGLAKAHDAGIVHRDLKPDNVMISRDGYAKILDFGLAKLVERPVSAEDATFVGNAPRSIPGIILGTLAYMSPEQAQGHSADARSDIFSFGSMLYEAASRRRAFGGTSVVDTLYNIVHTEPDFNVIDPRLARIARKCLAKDPNARYQSIRDVAHDLRMECGSGAAAFKAAALPPQSKDKTIAVLPFDDLSPAHDNEYFADGLAEEITSDLSKVHALRVISRASVRKYRGEEKVIDNVVAELGAQYVIDGSVRKAGNQLRITAQLIDAATKTQLWSEKYSGTLDEVFDIQENVARSVVKRLQVELTSGESALLAQREMSNIEVYDCYLRARRNIARFDEEGLTTALKEIENGIAIAGPNSALLAAEGYVYFQYYNLGIRPDPGYLDRAEAIARQIAEREPDSPHTHRLLGLVATQRQQMRKALAHLEKVLEVEPNDPDALMWLSYMRPFVGLDADEYAKRLAVIDPLSPTTFAALACSPLFRGEFDVGLPWMQRAAEAGSIFMGAYVQLSGAAGRNDELRRLLPHLEEHQNDDPFFAPIALVIARAVLGDHEGARKRLTPDLFPAARMDYQYSSWMAEIYAVLGEKDTALEWLENSIDRGFAAWPFLMQHDRLLDSLRDLPRFQQLMERAHAAWESYRR